MATSLKPYPLRGCSQSQRPEAALSRRLWARPSRTCALITTAVYERNEATRSSKPGKPAAAATSSSSATATPIISAQEEAASVGIATEPQTSPAADSPYSMSWTKQWWPVAVEESLDPDLPHKVTLMGRDLVVWRSEEGAWSCLDNACPHRGAPLDQGRVQGNCLQCSYHGWKFAVDGKCKDIPQATDPSRLCSMKAAQAGAHPVKAAQGLLWVWGEAGPAAAAEAVSTPLKADPDVDDDHKYTWRFPWLARDAMVSFEYALDNLFDIAHGPFAHDGVFGISAANNAPDLPADFELTPREMSLLTVPSTKPGDKIDLAKSTAVGTGQKMTFYFPVVAVADNFKVNAEGERTEDLLKLVVYRTPVRPGVSRVFYNMLLSTRMDPKQRAALTKSPPWDLHAQMLHFFDGDVVLIHDQERLVASKGGWRKAMFMPHSSDRGIAKFRAWFDKVGPIPYAGDTSLGPIQPRHVVLDHYGQHVKHCKTCQAAVARLNKVERGCLAAAALIGILCLKTARLSLSASPNAAVVALFVAPYLGLAAAAGLVLAASKVRQYVQDSFYFKDYVQSCSGR